MCSTGETLKGSATAALAIQYVRGAKERVGWLAVAWRARGTAWSIESRYGIQHTLAGSDSCACCCRLIGVEVNWSHDAVMSWSMMLGDVVG